MQNYDTLNALNNQSVINWRSSSNKQVTGDYLKVLMKVIVKVN